MKEYTRKLLDKALDAIEAAEGLMNMGKAEFSAGRAYYAMFYIAEALLGEKGYEFKQHGQVIGAFGLHFAKTKELDPKYHRWLVDGFDTRISGDYGVDTEIDNELVADMIYQAREFLLDARKYIETHGQ
jgi:uncharacterized protein (UPF0332 family)